MNKESLKRQFLMRHMPNALNGCVEVAFRQYYDELRATEDETGYNSTKYKTLAYEFFEGKVDNPREMVSYVFGTGVNKFWCFEHNLIDYPMDQFKTVNDIVVKLDDIQSELMDSDDFTYTPDHEIFNLWCCTSEPFENIIISSLKFMVSMQCHDIGCDWIKELCDQKDTRPDEIVIDEHGQWVNTAYFDDDINEKVYKKMLFAQNEINVRRTRKIVDSVIEQYPNTIFKNISIDDDITTYIVVDSNDSKNLTLDDFLIVLTV